MQQTLQPNTLLQGGRYKIIKTLGQGGFGITYLALQSGLERQVAVKEFFMKDFCERDRATSHVTLGMKTSRDMVKRFRAKFIKEARNIAKLNHPNIVRIIDVFEENGTAYYVMEYAEGGSLGEKLRKKGSFSKPVATRYITQVAEAVGYIHQRKMNHLDIKPDNIMLSGDDNVILIDFGLAKQYDATTGSQTSSTPVGISEGYAPIEQYHLGGVVNFTPETDIYTLGATFFKMLTGITPPSASDVLENGVPVDKLEQNQVSAKVVALITHAMNASKKNRLHSVSEFLQGLNTDSVSIADKEDTISLNINVLTFNVNGISFDMVKVESGTFTMGYTSEMKVTRGNMLDEMEDMNFDKETEEWSLQLMQDQIKDEVPAHKVTLSSYYIGKTVVTQGLWESVMGMNPSSDIGVNKPVNNVSWCDCQMFISRLNFITGKKFRLPTEAEWEFAARGGNNSRHYRYSGSNTLADVAWGDGDSLSDVALKKPNELGLYDMSGNVYEWCSDWYGNYSREAQSNPTGPINPNNDEKGVLRGGCYSSLHMQCRSSYRSAEVRSSHHSSDDTGFRLALSE